MAKDLPIGPWVRYRRKPVLVRAAVVLEAFSIKTVKGPIRVEKGDYLVRGAGEERYPVPAHIFEQLYVSGESPEVPRDE